MAYSKIIFGGQTLIDLTSDTVTADSLTKGATAHDKSGKVITGTNTKDVDSSSATATEDEILATKTAFARGAKLTGRMPNNGAITEVIATKEQSVTIPHGYHDGSGTVAISAEEQAKLVASNIREGITVLGVLGTMSGSESVKAQQKTATPSKMEQRVTPDDGYNYLSEVVVKAIPYSESPNSAGGMTATIG